MRPAVRHGVITLRYLTSTTNSAGQTYVYFRRGHGPRIPMPAVPRDDPAFLRAYAAALAGEAPKPLRSAPGTVAALAEAALRSDRAKLASASYRAMLRRHVDAIRERAGAAPVRGLREKHIRADLAQADNATDRLKAWRFLTRHGIEAGMLDSDPAATIRLAARDSDGHPPWTADDVARFRARWPVGTTARAAMELLHWTGARIGDAVLIGPQMVRGGVLTYRQGKTAAPAHCPWSCPLPAYAADMAADRAAMLAAIAPFTGHLTFLAAYGRTRSSKALGGLIREAAAAAGLDGKSAHGLRKARAVALAEAGATVHQIVAWTGHQTLKEAERYTKAADRRRAVMGQEQEQNTPNTPALLGKAVENP